MQQRTMRGLIGFARDFAYGVHAGHGIRHGVPQANGADCAGGDDPSDRVRAEPVESGRRPTAGGFQV
ncbi:hypothetical protein [Nocardia jinanensis]|uniref:Uncharacterized protein n=1 Tax=Nocardia jinanensis TaxID=382504 RepID=A0A917R8R5_9NOCA|nr:hypothetical protein [Nocardia jinanensis]GGK95946.1 hypothetical protein GCM10011588_07910 [Nocardia jinanensis]